MRIAFALMITLVGAAAFGTSCAADTTSDDLSDPNVRAKLRALGLQASAHAGVPSPGTMLAVESPDHQVAEEIVSGGSIVNDHAQVFVIVMTGGKFDPHVSSPSGVELAPSDVLTLTIDARTLMSTDAGFQATSPDLTQISPHVVNLLAD